MKHLAVLLAVLATACDSQSDPTAEPEADAAITPDAAANADVGVDAGEPDVAVPDAAPPIETPSMWGPAAAEGNPATWGAPVEIRLVAAPHTWALADGAEVDGLAYNGQVPGPTIQAFVGDEIVVHFENKLDEPTTIHWHGLRISEEMDGNPRIQTPVQPGETFTYRFVAREAGTFWYHPHVRANEAVEKGLYGSLVVHEPGDPQTPERVLMLDDLLLIDGEMPPFLASHPEVMHGRHGNILLTNGAAVAPQLQVDQGTTERWRITNTANARTMTVSVTGADFLVVGVDGGQLETPYEARRLNVAVGQRYDLEVRYTHPGTARLVSYVLTADGTVIVPLLEAEVRETGVRPTALAWPTVTPRSFRRTTQRLTLVFDGVATPAGETRWRINGRSDWGSEPVFTGVEGDVVEITLDNRNGPEHPFHLHGQFFEIESDGRAETDQPGLKDTVLVPGLSVVNIVAYLDNPGRWMAHCHILEHAELGMMSTFEVTPAPAER